MEKQLNDSCDNNCGLFDFMANTMGIKVLHPGGYEATKKLSEIANLNENSYMLDLACGAGTTSFFISKKYNCKISGIDISQSLIADANKSLKNIAKNEKINFKVGDAFELPFPDNTFDFVIAQAFFILIDNKEKALDEIYRVLKTGGQFGSIELSWFKIPSKEAYDEILKNTCSSFVPRMIKFEEWEEFFKSKKFVLLKTIKNPIPAGILQMLKAEGLINFNKIMMKMMGNTKNRNRMMKVQSTFKKYDDFIGYGIYSFRK